MVPYLHVASRSGPAVARRVAVNAISIEFFLWEELAVPFAVTRAETFASVLPPRLNVTSQTSPT